MMEGNGKEIIWQIKKTPCKVTSARRCARPEIIPVSYKRLETGVVFPLLDSVFGWGEGGAVAASARAEPSTGGATKGQFLQLQEAAHLKGKFHSQEACRAAKKNEAGLERSSRAAEGLRDLSGPILLPRPRLPAAPQLLSSLT